MKLHKITSESDHLTPQVWAWQQCKSKTVLQSGFFTGLLILQMQAVIKEQALLLKTAHIDPCPLWPGPEALSARPCRLEPTERDREPVPQAAEEEEYECQQVAPSFL